jgi:hypothetical protein
VAVLNESFLSGAFAGKEGQTPPFKGREHAAPALCKTTLITLSVFPIMMQTQIQATNMR